MKCASCYADNQPGTGICLQCGESVRSIRVCEAGHILPDGESECAVCPGLWPEVGEFEGPPVLRGVLWAIEGQLVSIAEDGDSETVAAVELRDDMEPLSLRLHGSDGLEIMGTDDPRADVKILVRPGGVGACLCPRLQSLTSSALRYETLTGLGVLAVETVRVGIGLFDVPGWVNE